jgi:hypothetical protein
MIEAAGLDLKSQFTLMGPATLKDLKNVATHRALDRELVLA